MMTAILASTRMIVIIICESMNVVFGFVIIGDSSVATKGTNITHPFEDSLQFSAYTPAFIA
jgi:hypothetical protein